MPRETLLDLFEDYAAQDDVFIVHDDGYRVRQVTYPQMARAARAFAERLSDAGIAAGDKVLIWSENRAEWIAAFWGCVLTQVVVVPVDFRASADLLRRVADIVKAKAILVGAETPALPEQTTPVWDLSTIVFSSTPRAPSPTPPAPSHKPPASSTLAEIIFTSGATADPKGVTITHRNILANLIPIEREIKKYRKYERPFHPIRFLNLLPLSHMFGQSMGAFIPPMIGGTVVFSHGYSPTEILHQIKSRRISVLVLVPKVLDVLREHVIRVSPMTAGEDLAAGLHFSRRWWRYRAVHRLFGWKFWCIVVGAAPLDPELETFWRKLGFVVVQGYGLTETAPVVTLNHPFRASRGTVGTPIAGVEVKIAADGEILVRGDNVTTGYYNADKEATTAFEDGWFHTGDIGEVDSAGRLLIKGRKKEMIVTGQGLNVFPEDVERALLAQPGVKDAGVVALGDGGEERVHAVLVVEPGTSTDAVVRGANSTLEDHQRVWSASIWPGETLPRTDGTQKLKRRELQGWASGERRDAPAAAVGGTTVVDVVRRFAHGHEVSTATTLDELGLSSLDRVELMMALEDAFQTTLDEAAIAGAGTVADLRTLVEGSDSPKFELRTSNFELPKSAGPGSQRPDTEARGSKFEVRTSKSEAMPFPSWNRSKLAWLARRVSLPTWILPLARPFLKLEVQGLEHLENLAGPVVFAANHQSHMDGPVIMIALPARFRYAIAPAVARDFFAAHYNRRQYGSRAWFTNSLNYYLGSLFFNTFPLPRREAGTRQTLRYIGDVTGDGYSILIFPEGERAGDGRIRTFRPGVGMMAARLDLPVVPVRIEGLDKVLHPKMKWPRRGPVRIAFGQPLRLAGEDYVALAKQVEDAVRGL